MLYEQVSIKSRNDNCGQMEDNYFNTYLTSIFTALDVACAEKSAGDGLYISAVAVFVSPNRKGNLLQASAVGSACVTIIRLISENVPNVSLIHTLLYLKVLF